MIKNLIEAGYGWLIGGVSTALLSVKLGIDFLSQFPWFNKLFH